LISGDVAMSFLKAFFNFRGRIGRADFWLLTLVPIAAMTLIWAAYAIELPGREVVSLVLFLAALVAWLSGAVRRLHDRGKSAWYLLLFVGMPTVLQNFFAGTEGKFVVYFISWGIGSAIDLICLGITIWMIAELGFLPSMQEQNRYGSNPIPLFSE
jgi:uncharacterized membrane protein YhaH (DUF805 family)